MADKDPKTPTEKEPKIAPVPPEGGQKVPAGAPKDVPIASAPADDDDDAGSPSDSPETRAERKRQRGEFVRRTEQAEKEARQAREEALLAKARLEAQQVHIEGLRAVMPQQPSPVDRQLEEISKQQDNLLKGWQGRLKQGETPPEEEANRTRAEWQRLADQRARLIAQSVSPQAQGPSPAQIQQMIHEAQLRAKYPDIYGAEEALAYANALAAKYQREGKVGPDAVEQVMQETRKRLGIGKGANGHQIDIDNQRFAGVPMGAAPMKGAPGHYRMSAAEQRMAHAQYPKDPPEVAEKKWAEKTGKKILSKQAK